MVVDEIDLQTQPPKESEYVMAPLRHAAEQIDEQQDEGDSERDIDHPLGEERKPPVPHLLQPDRKRSRHQKSYGLQITAQAPATILPNEFAAVVPTKKDRYVAPEDFDIAPQPDVHEHHPLHDDTPADHQHWQPAIQGMVLDEPHMSGAQR